MDIWLVAVLVAWIPVAAALALLVGRTLAQSEARDRLATQRVRAGDLLPVVVQRSAPRAAHRDRVEDAHRLAS